MGAEVLPGAVTGAVRHAADSAMVAGMTRWWTRACVGQRDGSSMWISDGRFTSVVRADSPIADSEGHGASRGVQAREMIR